MRARISFVARCRVNVSHWSTAGLGYWYPLRGADAGYKPYPLKPAHLLDVLTAPLLHTHTHTHTHILITISSFIISCSFRCVRAPPGGVYFFDRVISSHTRLISRLVNQDLGWRRTLASADHSFSPHRPAPSVVSAGTGGALRVESETEEREHQINCTAEIRTPAEPLCLSIIHTISPSCLLCLRFIDTKFQCWPQENTGDAACPCCAR